jgi:hypothetical protein
MSITTYAELQTSLASWTHRSDLTAQIPDFIAMAEDEMNAELRLRLMEVDESLSVASGARTVALPAGFIEPVKLELIYGDGSDNRALQFITMKQFTRSAVSGSSVIPIYWTINGANIEFPDPVDQAYTLTLRMLKRLNLASTSTNDLLTNYRGMYLYGALLQAAPYMANDARIPTWQRFYDRLKAQVMKKEARSKALAILMTDLPHRGYRSNILRG